MHTQSFEQEFKIPTVTFSELNEMALKFLHEKMPQFLTIPMAFDVDMMIEELGLPVIECEMSLENIMGLITFIDSDVHTKNGILFVKRRTILLNKVLRNDLLESRFTKAHEAAHWLIFERYRSRITEYYACSKELAERYDILYANKCVKYLDSHPDALLELHTDVLTCKITMPETTFIPTAKRIMKEHGFDDIYISYNKTETEFDKVVAELAAIYLVPTFAVRLHLQTCGLYEDYEG